MRWLAALALVACTQGPVRVHLERSTVPAYLDSGLVEATLESSVDWWRGCGFDVALDEGGAAVRFGPTEAGTNQDGVTTSDGGFLLDGAPGMWATPGMSCIVGNHVTLTAEAIAAGTVVNRLWLGDVMRHELGHLVGQHHEPDDWSVMSSGASVCQHRYGAQACHPDWRQ